MCRAFGRFRGKAGLWHNGRGIFTARKGVVSSSERMLPLNRTCRTEACVPKSFFDKYLVAQTFIFFVARTAGTLKLRTVPKAKTYYAKRGKSALF
jgi:hypothetical protein